jgi:hypothetical protein
MNIREQNCPQKVGLKSEKILGSILVADDGNYWVAVLYQIIQFASYSFRSSLQRAFQIWKKIKHFFQSQIN